ncbi:MAG TPA: CopD family protein [Rhodanobacteraceae bacterium]
MLWLKAFHVIFVVTWFAGLFYLPRLFIYHVEASEPAVRERLKVMEKRLLGITHIGAALAIVFGISLAAWFEMHGTPMFTGFYWFDAKLVLVALLVAYHVTLTRMTHRLRHDSLAWSSRGLRFFNEIPALLLIGIVILVVVKPF